MKARILNDDRRIGPTGALPRPWFDTCIKRAMDLVRPMHGP